MNPNRLPTLRLCPEPALISDKALRAVRRWNPCRFDRLPQGAGGRAAHISVISVSASSEDNRALGCNQTCRACAGHCRAVGPVLRPRCGIQEQQRKQHSTFKHRTIPVSS